MQHGWCTDTPPYDQVMTWSVVLVPSCFPYDQKSVFSLERRPDRFLVGIDDR